MKKHLSWFRQVYRGTRRSSGSISLCLGTCLLLLGCQQSYASVGFSAARMVVKPSQWAKQACKHMEKVLKPHYESVSKQHLVGYNEDNQTSASVKDGAETDANAVAPIGVLYTVGVKSGQQLPLETSVPLPYGEQTKDGVWSATYGAISKNGSVYTAPKEIPPFGGLDIIQYNHLSERMDTPGVLTLLITVYNPSQPTADKRYSPLKTYSLPLVPINKQSRPAFDRRTTASSWREANVSNALLHLASGKSSLFGYILPTWADAGDVQVYVPEINPDNGTQNSAPVAYVKGPVGPKPPHPRPGTPVGYIQDVATNIYNAPSDTSGWLSSGTIAITVDSRLIANVDASYGRGASAKFGLTNVLNSTIKVPVKYRSITQHQYYYIDSWRWAASSGWIWAGTDKEARDGYGELFMPAWWSVVSGYPPNGDPVWQQWGRYPVSRPTPHP